MNTQTRGVKKGWLLLAVGLQLVASAAIADQIEFNNLQFQSSGQSMWGPGNAPGLNIDRFLGVTWDESASIGGITGSVSTTNITFPHLHLPSGWECHGFLCTSGHFHNAAVVHDHEIGTISVDTRLGAEVDLTTSGKVGFQFGLTADSGSVNTAVQINAALVAPDSFTVEQGEFFNLNPSSSLAGGSLETNFPELTVGLDAIVGVRASASAIACAPIIGCTDPFSTGPLGFPDQTIPIISFNDPGSPGQIKILGQLDSTLFQFDSEINIPGAAPGSSLGGVTVHVPDINATGGVVGNKLTASGMDDLITLTADLDGLALAPLGLPGLGVTFDVGILSMGFDLIDIDMGPILKVLQNFEFTPTLMVELAFDSDVQIAGFATPQRLWFGAWADLPSIALLAEKTLVTPTFSMGGLFMNDTALGIDGLFRLEILKASFALEAFSLSFDLGQIGPLFKIMEQTNLFNTPPLFSNSYNLGGFNTVVGDSFLLERIPEPGSLMLLMLGLAVLGAKRRHP